MEIRGTVAPGWEGVRDAFASNAAQRGERGAAVAVYRHGRLVVDLWGGSADADDSSGRPWESGTAQILHSATKGVAAAVLLRLNDQGLLELDAPVGAYWPEFKAHGKEQVTVRQVLSHQAGLPVLDRPLTPREAADGVTGPAAVAAQRPLWEPGTAHGYHPHTFSWLTGELVRRVTGRSLGTVLAEEIARPLGLELWIGLPASEQHRVGRTAPLRAPEPAPGAGALKVRPRRDVAAAYADPGSVTRRAFGAVSPAPEENEPYWRAAELPGANGIATARGLAGFYSALLHGDAVLRPETLAEARSEQAAGPDRVLVVNSRFGLGFMLHGSAAPMGAPGAFGHPGRGGPLGYGDPESGVAFGYVTNGMQASVTSDARAQALVRAVRAVCAHG
jgi:CubicO group peptidase (beta-lactamase class C family)